MGESEIKKRKTESNGKDHQNGNGKAKASNGSNGKASSGKSRSSSGLMKGVLGFAAVALAVLLYQGDYIALPGSSTSRSTTKLSADIPKRDAIVAAFKHAWSAYERDAMGADTYHPLTKKGSNISKQGGIGSTLVGALDTMQLMGLTEEYARAKKWIQDELNFDKDGQWNTYQLTSNVLAGLLSAHHLSSPPDPIFLQKATDLAQRILPAFDTPSGLPMMEVNLGKRKGVEDPNNVVVLKEVAGIQLEMRYLSKLAGEGEGEYWDKAEAVMRRLRETRQPKGLPTLFFGSESGRPLTSEIRVGQRTDVFYEYLLKQYLQTDRTEDYYRTMYDNNMNAIHDTVLGKSPERNLTHMRQLTPHPRRRGYIEWASAPRHDYAACSLGGTLLHGAVTTGANVYPVSVPPKEGELTEEGRRNWQTGMELIKTCLELHRGTATGLAPEIAHFRYEGDGLYKLGGGNDWYIKDAKTSGKIAPPAARYLLSPETIESLFLAYRLTGNPEFREEGWKIFEAIEKHCRVESGGYAGVLNVDDVEARKEDRMDAGFLSETLKYLYLLFEDETVVPLDKYVMTSQGHPLPIFTPELKRRISA